MVIVPRSTTQGAVPSGATLVLCIKRIKTLTLGNCINKKNAYQRIKTHTLINLIKAHTLINLINAHTAGASGCMR